MRIIGIDPGLNCTGYGIIRVAEGLNPQLFNYGSIKTNAHDSLAVRLYQIFEKITQIVDEYKPDTAAFESVFYAENVKTAIIMGHARGAAMVAAMSHHLDLFEYSPREIKMSVVGNGAASKEQVNYMVRQILCIKENIKPDDASDALAAALCHWHRSRFNKMVK